ncbi:MAG: transposase [Anaerolineales bacterium]|nr:hypothetical protein [Anaerolineales bacterium]MDW8447945.1 transposase [Anaerolineales bacterium]
MKYNPQHHHRRSIRLPGYDYTQPGAYFVTLVTHERQHLFGEIVVGEMHLNPWGEVAYQEWFQTAVLRPYVVLRDDEWVVMPNHMHGIIWIVDNDCRGAAPHPAPCKGAAAPRPSPRPSETSPINVVPGSLGAIVRAYKSAVAKRINALRNTPGAPVWQRNYYEHIIRDDGELERIRQYILDNPARWAEDRENLHVVTVAQGRR